MKEMIYKMNECLNASLKERILSVYSFFDVYDDMQYLIATNLRIVLTHDLQFSEHGTYVPYNSVIGYKGKPYPELDYMSANGVNKIKNMKYMLGDEIFKTLSEKTSLQNTELIYNEIGGRISDINSLNLFRHEMLCNKGIKTLIKEFDTKLNIEAKILSVGCTNYVYEIGIQTKSSNNANVKPCVAKIKNINTNIISYQCRRMRFPHEIDEDSPEESYISIYKEYTLGLENHAKVYNQICQQIISDLK